MKLNQLSDQELDQQLANRISKEREVLSEILYLIIEVDRRKIYLDRAYPSLFEYLVKHHGYSSGSAHRRIEAARLMKDIPNLPEKLESGVLNLSQVGLVQKVIRQNKIKASKEEKIELIQSLQNKTFAESQILVAHAFDLEVKEETKIQHQKNESVRIEVTFSKEQWQKVKQMQALLFHSLPNGNDLVQTLEYLAERVIKQKAGLSNAHSSSSQNSIRKAVLQKGQCCQFTDPQTQKICGSKNFLQIDHIKPKWAGGNDSFENLQVLCAAHNQHKYQKQAGIRHR